MKKGVSILAGVVMSLFVVAGNAQDANNAGAETVNPKQSCSQSLVKLEDLRKIMEKETKVNNQAELQNAAMRALTTLLGHCTAAFSDLTASSENIKMMNSFAGQLSNNKYIGLTMAEERYLREKAKEMYGYIVEAYPKESDDDKPMLVDIEKQQFSNSNKLKNLNNPKTVKCELAWLNIQAAFEMIDKVQSTSVKENSFNAINTQQFAVAMNKKRIELIPSLKKMLLDHIAALDGCDKAASLGVEQAYLPISLGMTFDATKHTEQLPVERICENAKHWFDKAVEVRVGFGSGSPGEPNKRLMVIPDKSWLYECPLGISELD